MTRFLFSSLFLALAACGMSVETSSEPAPAPSVPSTSGPTPSSEQCDAHPTVTADIPDHATAQSLCDHITSNGLSCEICVQQLDADFQPASWFVAQSKESVCACDAIGGSAVPSCTFAKVTWDVADLSTAQSICQLGHQTCEICAQEQIGSEPPRWSVFQGADNHCPCPPSPRL